MSDFSQYAYAHIHKHANTHTNTPERTFHAHAQIRNNLYARIKVLVYNYVLSCYVCNAVYSSKRLVYMIVPE